MALDKRPAERHIDVRSELMKLTALHQRFLADLRAIGRAPATVAAYQSDFRRFLGWLGRDDVRAFTQDAALGWAAALRDGGAKVAGVQRRVCSLGEFGKWLARRGDLPRSPLEGIPRPRRPKRLPRPVPRERAAAVLGQGTAIDHAIVALMRYAGLRVGEVANLEADDIDVSAGRLFVRQGKGGRDRVVPIVPALAAALGPILPPAGLLFRAPRGGPLTRKTVGRRLDRLSKLAGVQRFTPHQLRHTFATEAVRAHINPRVIQQLMGHSDLATTALYLEANGEDIVTAARVLAAADSGTDASPALEVR